MRRQWNGLAEGDGGSQVNHGKRFGSASPLVCRRQSILSCKYRKIWQIVYSLTAINRPSLGKRISGRLMEVKTPETVLIAGTLFIGRLIPDLSNRKPNKKPIEPNRTPIVRLGSAIEQNRTPILL